MSWRPPWWPARWPWRRKPAPGEGPAEGARAMPCGATIEFGDDQGDNVTTFHCRLGAGHAGPHEERGDRGCGEVGMPYTLTWEGSEAEVDAQYGPERHGHATG